VQALPFVVSLAAALALAPALLRSLADGGMVRENYRGERLAFPFGVLIVFAAVIALIPLAPIDQYADDKVFRPELGSSRCTRSASRSSGWPTTRSAGPRAAGGATARRPCAASSRPA
jgi:hypothetical protein